MGEFFARRKAGLLVLALLGMAWASPSLELGLLLDDRMHRDFVQNRLTLGEFQLESLDMFGIARTADMQEVRMRVYMGLLPWWTSDDFSVSFLRPLAVASHFLDYGLWPGQPWLMHVHNLLWYGLMLLLVGALYRRLLGTGAAATIALLLFALDDAHVEGAAWLAGRNTLMTGVFIAATLLVHDRGRRDGDPNANWLAPLLLLLGFASSEGTVAIWAYLIPYALLIDRGAIGERISSLVPLGTVTLVWQLLYRGLGYGARGSALYADPGGDPLHFLAALIERYPIVMRQQFGLPFPGDPASDLAVLVGVLLAGALLLRFASERRVVAFFFAGALLAAVPTCAVEVSPRLLFPVSIGGCAFLAQLLVAGGRAARSGRLAKRVAGGVAVVAVAALHLVAPAVLMPTIAPRLAGIDGAIAKRAATLPWNDAEPGTILAVLNVPNLFMASLELQDRVQKDGPVPFVAYLLGVSERPVKLVMESPSHFLLEPEGGYLADRWSWLVRGAGDRFEKGDDVRLAGMFVAVEEVTSDGRPAVVRVTYHDKDGPISWVTWDGARQRYVPFELPPVGSVTWLSASPTPRRTSAPGTAAR